VVEIIRSCDRRTGYNAMTGRYEDLLNAGVVDLVEFLGVHFKVLSQLLG
jgi:hypothetical protein